MQTNPEGPATFSAGGHFPGPGLVNLHYLSGIITMNLHYLDLTPLQFWRAGAPQSVMLGEVRGFVRHPPPHFRQHLVAIPTVWPTLEQLAPDLYFCIGTISAPSP